MIPTPMLHLQLEISDLQKEGKTCKRATSIQSKRMHGFNERFNQLIRFQEEFG